MKRKDTCIYLDYAATTPLDARVFSAMQPYLTIHFGNPGSVHVFGQEALAAIDKSREIIARCLQVEFNEIIFTGSATEANNLAIQGVLEYWMQYKRKSNNIVPRIITTELEHDSVREVCRGLEKKGVEIVYLPLHDNGTVKLEALSEALNDRPILVSVMYANNEIGVIEPVQKVSEIVQRFRNSKSDGIYPLLHTDAVQALQFLDCKPHELGVDLMTLSSHKIYGPKGVGALYAKNQNNNEKNIAPIIYGGGQEWGMRSGTENTSLIVGFAHAFALLEELKQQETIRITELRDYFLKRLQKVFGKSVVLNGSLQNRIPNNLNIAFLNHDATDLIVALDINGVAASYGSACSSRAWKPSPVLNALGLQLKYIRSSIRFSLGRMTKRSDINRTITILKKITSHVRK